MWTGSWCKRTAAKVHLYPRRREKTSYSTLFSDLTGYTAMTEKLDPEEVKENNSSIFFSILSIHIIGTMEGFYNE